MKSPPSSFHTAVEMDSLIPHRRHPPNHHTALAEKVEAPIHAIGGDVDPRCPPEQLPEWDRYTSNKCDVQVFAGGHFFLKESSEKELMAWITKTLTADA